jgi:hypothetical protein
VRVSRLRLNGKDKNRSKDKSSANLGEYSSLDAAVPLCRIVLPGKRLLNRGAVHLVLLD